MKRYILAAVLALMSFNTNAMSWECYNPISGETVNLPLDFSKYKTLTEYGSARFRTDLTINGRMVPSFLELGDAGDRYWTIVGVKGRDIYSVDSGGLSGLLLHFDGDDIGSEVELTCKSIDWW